MYNYSEARDVAFKDLTKCENVKIIEKEGLGKKFSHFKEVWEINKSVLGPDGNGISLKLYLGLLSDFPFKIPTIYLSKKSYDRIKYIPHIDSAQLICTFDTETTRTNPQDPYGIVYDCLKRACSIIEAGLKKNNFKDFEDEFLSYWECQFNMEENVNREILSLINDDPDKTNVRLLRLNRKFGVFTHILYQNNEENERFLKFFEEVGFKHIELDIFYIGEIQFSNFPPYELTNKAAIARIKDQAPQKYNDFVNKLNRSSSLFVLFKKTLNGKAYYLGYFHSKPILTQPGFRNGKLSPFTVLTQMAQSSEKVIRVSPEEYTNVRMQKRTSGGEVTENYKFTIAGIGSVGSNLAHFLNSVSYPTFRLIDYDILTIENMGRHLVGMNYLGMYKTIAVKDQLKNINPKQDILTKETSIIEVLETDSQFINNSDFLFVVTGKLNIENWVLEKMKTKEIIKPVFILWVEPYLAAGHCIYLHPDNIKYQEFYHSHGDTMFFNGNVIRDDMHETKKEILTLKEAGCQTSFIPYSGSNVILFLSTMYPWILSIIKNRDNVSKAASWVGDKKVLDDLGLEFSDFGKNHRSFELIEHEV